MVTVRRMGSVCVHLECINREETDQLLQPKPNNKFASFENAYRASLHILGKYLPTVHYSIIISIIEYHSL